MEDSKRADTMARPLTPTPTAPRRPTISPHPHPPDTGPTSPSHLSIRGGEELPPSLVLHMPLLLSAADAGIIQGGGGAN